MIKTIRENCVICWTPAYKRVLLTAIVSCRTSSYLLKPRVGISLKSLLLCPLTLLQQSIHLDIQAYRDERGSFLRLANNFLAIISLEGWSRGTGEGLITRARRSCRCTLTLEWDNEWGVSMAENCRMLAVEGDSGSEARQGRGIWKCNYQGCCCIAL